MLIGSDNSFRYWGDLFIAKKSGKVCYSQIRNLRCYLNHLYGYIGDKPINTITPDDIDLVLDRLTQKNPHTQRPTSHQHLLNVRNAASDVFEMAIDRDVLSKNPARKCEVSKYAPKKERRSLTESEQKGSSNLMVEGITPNTQK